MKSYILNRCHLLYVNYSSSVKIVNISIIYFPNLPRTSIFPSELPAALFLGLPLLLRREWDSAGAAEASKKPGCTPTPVSYQSRLRCLFRFLPHSLPADSLERKNWPLISTFALPHCPSQCVAPTALPRLSAAPNQPLKGLQWGPTPFTYSRSFSHLSI